MILVNMNQFKLKLYTIFLLNNEDPLFNYEAFVFKPSTPLDNILEIRLRVV